MNAEADTPFRTEATKAMAKALVTASQRDRANICPIPGVHAAAETAIIKAMDARGYIVWDGVPFQSAPRISAAARILALSLTSTEAAS